MTKSEAKSEGQARGMQFAEGFTEEQLRGGLDAQRENIRQAAASFAVANHFRSVDSGNAQVFIEAYVQAAGMRFLGRRRELPDVKAAERAEYVARYFAQEIVDAQATIASWRKSLDENPTYAFQWSDATFKAAAALDVLIRFKEINELAGTDKMLEEARSRVISGAKYPPASTSMPSNLIDTYKTAALASLVESLSVRF